MNNSLREDYFKWMYNTVCDGRFADENGYHKLLSYLDRIDYYWILPDDSNRAADGEEDLRWRFLFWNGLEEHVNELRGPCSVLEMILAMAYRCEEIMDDAVIGDRTGQWFWNMINNLGLGGMTDSRFDINYVEEVIEKFLNRDYEPNGRGSLFVVRNCDVDLRDVNTWTCMLWYLDSIT